MPKSLGLKSLKDSWALQDPEVGSITYSPAEVLKGCLFPQDPCHALGTERTQEPSLASQTQAPDSSWDLSPSSDHSKLWLE